MNRHHAHSHRERRRGRRVRTADQQLRIERRRQELAHGPVEVVVQVPWGRRATAGQQAGVPIQPGRGFISRWISERSARRQLERLQAENA